MEERCKAGVLGAEREGFAKRGCNLAKPGGFICASAPAVCSAPARLSQLILRLPASHPLVPFRRWMLDDFYQRKGFPDCSQEQACTTTCPCDPIRLEGRKILPLRPEMECRAIP